MSQLLVRCKNYPTDVKVAAGAAILGGILLVGGMVYITCESHSYGMAATSLAGEASEMLHDIAE